jgi:predicted MFS family arabinose efflux permease
MCAFGSAAYAAALVISRGFGADAVSLVLAVIGVAFIASSILTPEVLGRSGVNLRWLVAVAAALFFSARAAAFLLPVSLFALLALFALASVMDGCIGVAMRSQMATYDVADHALSMVFFAACDGLGQTLGGILAGTALALSGYGAIGLLVAGLGVLAVWLPIASGRPVVLNQTSEAQTLTG